MTVPVKAVAPFHLLPLFLIISWWLSVGTYMILPLDEDLQQTARHANPDEIMVVIA